MSSSRLFSWYMCGAGYAPTSECPNSGVDPNFRFWRHSVVPALCLRIGGEHFLWSLARLTTRATLWRWTPVDRPWTIH